MFSSIYMLAANTIKNTKFSNIAKPCCICKSVLIFWIDMCHSSKSKFSLEYLRLHLSLLRQFFPVSAVRLAKALLQLWWSRAVSSLMLRTSFTLSIQVFGVFRLGFFHLFGNTSPSSFFHHVVLPFEASGSQNVTDLPQPAYVSHCSILHMVL